MNRAVVWIAIFVLLGCSGQPAHPPSAADAATSTDEPTPDIQAPIEALAPGEPESGLPVEADDGRLGDREAAVTVVAFLDYECGFCARGFETLMALRDQYEPDELRIVFKHVPLDFHPNALPAAVAGQAVQLAEGSKAFFQFSDLAFSQQGSIDYVKLAEWASQVGVDRRLYNQLVSDETTVRRVARDVMLARSLGVTGTPAFFINGRLLEGAQPIGSFRTLIDAELAAMTQAPATKWQERYTQRLRHNLTGTLAESLLAKDPRDYRVPVGDSPVQGPEDALVTVVMFTDFECPFCKRVEPTLREFVAKHPSDVRLVFKHLPLPFHERARPASRLAEQVHLVHGDAAFFRVVAELFEASPALDDATLTRIGEDAGLSAAEIDAALAGTRELEERLEQDETLAEDVQARGTPHFFVNGKRLTGARPLDHFEALFVRQKAQAEQLLASGVPRNELYAALQKDAIQPGAPERIEHDLAETGHPTLGSADAPVTIHVFSDFQCPFCRRAEPVLDELRERYRGQLRFVWHDLPLPFHERALPAARAAREAYRQGGNTAFWKMHDALFNLEGEEADLSRSAILEYARAQELDITEFERALDADDEPASIARDVELATRLDISGTPAFVVGHYVIRGAQPIGHFIRVIELALQDAEQQASTPEN